MTLKANIDGVMLAYNLLVGFFSAGLLSAFQSGDGRSSMLLTITKLRQYQFDMLFMYVSRNMLVSAHIHKM